MRNLLLTVAASAVVLLAGQATGQGVAASTGQWEIVQAGRLLDQPGKAPRGASSILIHDGQIVEVKDGFVGPEGFANVPPSAQVIDLKDSFVLPGLIDSHVHLDSDRAGVEAQLAAVTDSVADSAYEAQVNARKTLEAGFTTVRNLGNSNGVTLSLRDAVARGWVEGPRILDAGQAISTTSGHMDERLGYSDNIREAFGDRKSTRLNSSHTDISRMPSSA